MKIPDRRLSKTSPTSKVFHISDWRRRYEHALCDILGVGRLGAQVIMQEPPGNNRLCKKCVKIEFDLSLVRIYVRSESAWVGGMTLSDVVKLAMKQGIPADAEFTVKDDYGDQHPALEWSVTE